jgi:hypothetical protein
MPLTGQRLVIEPTYPKAKELEELLEKPREPKPEDDFKIRNAFWSDRLRAEVYIYEDDTGKVCLATLPIHTRTSMDLNTLGCSEAWGLEQEGNALKLLGTLISHRQLKQYVLTGGFLERSKRSGLTYWFRRLKPTVVLDARDREATGKEVKILCALCMHPIAYYRGTWAGAMCPTDDVVAHLMMMRGDEHMLWRRANQHPPGRPEAGL